MTVGALASAGPHLTLSVPTVHVSPGLLLCSAAGLALIALASLGLSAVDSLGGDFDCVAVTILVSVSLVGAGSTTGGSSKSGRVVEPTLCLTAIGPAPGSASSTTSGETFSSSGTLLE